MWMWDKKERLTKFLKATQKWMQLEGEDSLVSKEVAEQAFNKAQLYAGEILQTFAITNPGTASFLQSWIELGIFSGYLAGWKNADKVLGTVIVSSDFYLTAEISNTARKFALENTDISFKRLFTEPVSPLVKGLDDEFIKLLKLCHESSLYSGFLSGLEDAFKIKGKISPFDLDNILT